tara:strand:- start:1851 stop:5234 length:3384 start_codon:yes stop_codon:yes gene_type:complete
MGYNIADNIIGTFLPKTHIERVVLESSAGKFLPKADNPHIMDEGGHRAVGEHGRIFDEDGGMKCTVYLTVKDKVSNDLFGTWFNNQDVLSLINVEVLECREREITDFIIDKNLTRGMGSPGGIFGGSVDAAKEELSGKIVRAIRAGKVQRRRFTLRDFVEQDNDGRPAISSLAKVGLDGETIYDFTLKVEFDIHETSNPEHLSFFANSFLSPDFLEEVLLEPPSALLVGEMEVETVISESQLKSRRVLFLDAETSKVWPSSVHRDDDGTWRSGIAHDDNREERLLNRTVVTNSRVQDFRVFKKIERIELDFNVLENKLFNVQNKLKILNNDILDIRRTPSYITDGFLSRSGRGQYELFFGLNLSKLAKEQTLYGNFFGDNMEELNSSIYLSSLKVWRKRINSPVTSEVLGEQEYEDWDGNEPHRLIITTAATRDGDNTVEGVEFFDYSDPSLSMLSVMKEVDFSLGGDSEVKHYNVKDLSFEKITDGHYQYGVEMVVEDNTWKFIGEKLQELTEAYTNLVSYHNEATRVGVRRTNLVNNNPHINHPSERLANAVEVVKENYDPISNRFTANFLQWASELVGESTASERAQLSVAKLVKIIRLFENATRLPASERESFEQQRGLDLSYVRDFFDLLVDPVNGNPDGIAKILSIMEDLISKLVRVVGLSAFGTPQGDSLAGPPSKISFAGIGGSKRKINIFKWLPFVVDSNIPNETGYNYHSIDFLNRVPRRRRIKSRISLEDYKERVRREVLKYHIPDDGINIFGKQLTLNGANEQNYLKRTATIADSAYTFLTPSSIHFDGDVFFTGLRRYTTTIHQHDIYNELLVKLHRYTEDAVEGDPSGVLPSSGFKFNRRLEDRGIDASEQLTKFLLQKLFANENVIVLESVTEGTALDEQGIEESFLVRRATEEMDAGNEDAAENIERILAERENARLGVGELTRPNNILLRLLNDFNHSVEDFDLSVRRNAIDSAPDSTWQDVDNIGTSGKVDALPNHFKALFERSNGIRKMWHIEPFDSFKSSQNVGTLVFNYKLVKQVQVLTGYERTPEGIEQPKSPTFEPLTVDKIVDFEFDDSRKNLFCRIVPFKSADFPTLNQFANDSRLELPLYNEYFTISKEVRSIVLDENVQE